MVAIQTVINENFLDRVAGLAQGERREGAALARALSGSGEGENRISTTLRTGAQSYARALSGINFGATFLNFARSGLEQLKGLTEEMIESVAKAADPRGTKNDRIAAQRLVSELGQEFNKILKEAKVGDREYLTSDGIRDIFTVLGLDPQQIREIKSSFADFEYYNADKELADPNIKGKDTDLPREFGRANAVHNTAELFDGSRSILKRADAQAMLDDLNALRGQLTQNVEVIDELTGTLGEHARLVRTTALAFLEIGDSIQSDTDAKEVAKQLQILIRKNATEALSHAENLEPIILATLDYEDNGIVTNGF